MAYPFAACTDWLVGCSRHPVSSLLERSIVCSKGCWLISVPVVVRDSCLSMQACSCPMCLCTVSRIDRNLSADSWFLLYSLHPSPIMLWGRQAWIQIRRDCEYLRPATDLIGWLHPVSYFAQKVTICRLMHKKNRTLWFNVPICWWVASIQTNMFTKYWHCSPVMVNGILASAMLYFFFVSHSCQQ